MTTKTKMVLMFSAAQLIAAPVFAQEAAVPAADESQAEAAAGADEAATAGDIVVTAQRRAESLQRVPIALSAVGGEALAQIGVTDLSGLAPRVPSFNMGAQVGGAKITIRGIGLDTLAAGAEAPVAFHQDGVFIQRTAGSVASFFDIERVEVLRGPQGTLYGRNATGGAVNIISRDPTAALDGYMRITAGTQSLLALEGAVGGPLADGVRARVAFRTTDRDGFGKNIVTGHDIDDQKERAIRGKLELIPTDRLRILLAADYTHADDRGNGTWHYLGQGAAGSVPLGTVFGGILPTRLRDVASEYDPFRKLEAWGLSATASYDFGFGTLRSITAYRRTKWWSRLDLDATSFQLFSPMDIREDARQFSQEVQLSGSTDRTNWLIGAFHFEEKDNGFMYAGLYNGLFFPPPGAYVTKGYYAGSYIETNAQAVFGQVTHRLFDDLSVTVGARYSTEKKGVIDQQSIDIITPASNPYVGGYSPAFGIECSKTIQMLPVCDPEKRWSSFTPKLGIEYQATRDAMIYASATKGFRAGIYSLGAVQAPVDPETVWSYEVGLKSKLFGNRLRANLAAFYYDYTDLQVTKAAGTQTVMENAATARVKGLEAEIVARPISNFQLDFTGSYLDAKFRTFVSADPARPAGDGQTTDNGVPAFNLAGNRLPQAPKLSFLVGAQLEHETAFGNFTLRGELSQTSRVYFSAFNRQEVSVGSRTRINAYLNFATLDDRWTLSLVGRNLTNKVAATNAYVASALVGYVINANIEQPRTIALTAGYNF